MPAQHIANLTIFCSLILQLQKNISNFVVQSMRIADIFDESVLAFILEWKSGKFQLQQGEQDTRHLVFGVVALSLPYTCQYGCGVLFICCKGLPEPPF